MSLPSSWQAPPPTHLHIPLAEHQSSRPAGDCHPRVSDGAERSAGSASWAQGSLSPSPLGRRRLQNQSCFKSLPREILGIGYSLRLITIHGLTPCSSMTMLQKSICCLTSTPRDSHDVQVPGLVKPDLALTHVHQKPTVPSLRTN